MDTNPGLSTLMLIDLPVRLWACGNLLVEVTDSIS
jgi:hypothetical protein